MLREGSNDVTSHKASLRKNTGKVEPRSPDSLSKALSTTCWVNKLGEKKTKLLHSYNGDQHMLLHFSEDYSVYLLSAVKCQPDDTCNPELIWCGWEANEIPEPLLRIGAQWAFPA